MLAERDPNVSGRTSRASNLSAMSRATHKHSSTAGKQDTLASAPGVMSMLRTTTEMGNLGGLTGNLSGGDAIPRAPSRRGASSRLSTASSMSGTSSRASRHYRQWPSSSAAVRRSSSREFSGPQYVADTLSPTLMNIPGSSPLVPKRLRSRSNQDGHRSFSMTTTTQPSFRLSSNRSLGSLRGHEHMQQSRSQYSYPTRLRRPSHRPSSPPVSDSARSHSRRPSSRGSQGQVYNQGYTRQRTPFDAGISYQDTMLHRRPSGVPSRAPYGEAYGDVPPLPPVPPLFYSRMPVDQVRSVRRSAKGSFSSGSTNLRTDSDAPSSDLPSPPTPREGSSLEVLLTRTGSQILETVASVSIKEQTPLYYDYSEQFEHMRPVEPEVTSVLSGAVQDIRPMGEDRDPPQTSPATVAEAVGNVVPAVADLVELPASPVAKRITRDIVLQVLEAPSTVDSNASVGFLGEATVRNTQSTIDLPTDSEQNIADSAHDSPATRKIPDTSSDLPLSAAPDRSSFSSPGMEPSTEGDMSDLLAGYQHTEDKQQDETVQDGENAATNVPGADLISGARSQSSCARNQRSHAPKLSDEQSFKSCTDVLEPKTPPSQANGQDARSLKSYTDVLNEYETNRKRSEGRSLSSYKDFQASGRSVSVPPSSLPSLDLPLDFHTPRPFSEAQLRTPSRAVLKKPRVPPFDLNFGAADLRSSSQPSIKQRAQSAVASSATLIVAQQPPVVPPRDSSASKEAQRSLAVGAWMLRSLRWGRRQSKNEETERPRESEKATKAQSSDVPQPSSSFSSQQIVEYVIATPEKSLSRQDIVQPRIAAPTPFQSIASPRVSYGDLDSIQHQHSSSNPVPVAAETSSVYSPQQSTLRSRVQSSPAGVPGSPAHNRPDSQTTTHLIWHGRNAHALPPASASEPHLRSTGDQEDTTTDLRLSQYRYNAPLHYLPDLKEESHEDSSLNTSASNLKSSNFRFPFGAPLAMRTSVDEGVRFSRRSSLGSQPKGNLGSALAQAHGLPSMNFSRMDLLEKLDEEFGLHGSHSLDALRPASLSQHDGSPQRPVSAAETDRKHHNSVTKPDKPRVPEDRLSAKGTGGGFILRRTQSPELLAEIDQLAIPSVGGLTQRISEFLPSLREGYDARGQGEFPAEEVIMEHAMEEIHEIGGPAQKRSSARLRPMPGSPDMVVVDDALYEDILGRNTDGDGSGSPGGGRAAGLEGSEGTSVEGKGETVPQTHPQRRSSPSILGAPSNYIVRTRSHAAGDQTPRATVESSLLHRRSLRSFASTLRTTDTQPWHSDKSYPWATTTIPSVDISLPPPAAARHSPLPGPSHLRNRLSNTSTASTFVLNTPVGSHLESATATSAQACRLHRFSIFGANSDQSHAAGERYPTSALTPPTAIFRDHFSASDTSDDEIEPPISRKGKFSLKKRFSSARKATIEISTRAASKKTNSSSPNPRDILLPCSPVSAASILQDKAGEAQAFTTTNRHTFRDAEGMRSATYHRYRLVDHLKRWWHKGGDLLRRLSTRSE